MERSDLQSARRPPDVAGPSKEEGAVGTKKDLRLSFMILDFQNHDLDLGTWFS